MEIYSYTKTAIKLAKLGQKVHGSDWNKSHSNQMFSVFVPSLCDNKNFNVDKYYKICHKWVKRGQKCNT
mgnify:CR=1 FL=1|tara:strand:+ start:915 stop:1121 length:207 start_codon:yes stop_codon:yes gene_type:complete